MMVRCEKNGADYCSPFTDGAVYEAVHHRNSLWAVQDDLGYVRFIIPGETCPHLQVRLPDYSSKCVGIFRPLDKI